MSSTLPLWRAVRHGLVTGLVAFGVFGTATLVMGQGARTHDDRPFKATAEGATVVTPGQNPGQFDSVSEGAVIGTHLGHGEYEIQAMQDYVRHVYFPDPGTNDCAFVHGQVTLRAANGDEIHGEIDPNRSVSCVSVDIPGPGPDAEYLSTLYIEVVGGTGRFTDAEGWLFSRGTSTLEGIDEGTGSANFTDVSVILGDIDY